MYAMADKLTSTLQYVGSGVVLLGVATGREEGSSNPEAISLYLSLLFSSRLEQKQDLVVETEDPVADRDASIKTKKS